MEAPPNAQKQITTTDAPQWLRPISEQPAALGRRFAYIPSMLGRVRNARGRPKNAPAVRIVERIEPGLRLTFRNVE
jgi:hypothetical protein